MASPTLGTSGSRAASSFTASPLRNRLRVDLGASPQEVWALVGDLRRFLEYSLGLEQVDVKEDSSGNSAEYVCHFKPQDDGTTISHREYMRWFEPNRGFASVAEAGNAFGLVDALTLVTVEPSTTGTTLTWDQYYEAEDLEMNRDVFDEALADIGANLVARFEGAVTERYVDR
jgi:Polyketide cyclase / dehydrase and lipid transport